MAKPGRPRIQINWDEFDKLVGYQCTQEEIADFFDCSVDLLEDAAQRDRGCHLADLWDKKKRVGRLKLRKIQFDIAESGGPGAAAMAIYLGKVVLNQSDQPTPPAYIGSSPFGLAPEQKKSFTQFCVDAGYPPPFPRQIEMQKFGIAIDDPRLLLGARGYGKSDYVTVLGTAYDIYIEGAKTSNLIISKSKTRNTAMLGEIAGALKANGVPLEKENSVCIRVAGMHGKDHSCEVLTIKSSFRGRHPKRIIMDDPVTEEDTSEAMRVLVKKKYDEAYKLCKNIVIIGQPAHAFDLYAELRPMIKKLEVPHGEIPELDADLEAMKLAGIDSTSISMSYHLKIPANGAMIFSNIKYIDSMIDGDSVAFLDPADGGDFSAISIFKGYGQGIAVQGHAYKRAWYHALDEIVPILQAHRVRRLCFETNCTGTQPLIQLRGILGPLGIGVVGSQSSSNKHATIVAAGSFAHLIHLSKQSDQVYIQQVVRYEKSSKNDDAPDSLARGLEWLGLIKGKK